VITKTALAALAGKGMCCWHCRSVASCCMRAWRMGSYAVHDGILDVTGYDKNKGAKKDKVLG